MDYIGSKLKLQDWISQYIKEYRIKYKLPKNCILLDACAGSGIMSQRMAREGYFVVSNDIMKFPSVIVNGSICLTSKQKKEGIFHIHRINELDGISGFFHKHFTPACNRMYFTESNGKKIDAIRAYIDEKIKDSKVKDYLLYCGLEAVSRASNTVGVQAAYLKKFKERSNQSIIVRAEKCFDGKITTFNKDILVLLPELHKSYKEDILYIDPPYNQRQYGPNYHLYETFVRYDNPILKKGKTGLRMWENESKSKFCSKKECLNFLFEIIKASTARCVFVSYNSDGIFEPQECKDFCKSNNFIFSYKYKAQSRYKSDVSNERKYNKTKLREFLFIIEKM